jgi:hypothetical protein
LLNLGNGVNVTPSAIVVNGSNTGNPGRGNLAGTGFGNGGLTVSYQNGAASSTACATTALSSPTLVNFAPTSPFGTGYNFLFTTDGCGNATNMGQYAWLYFTLDDSQTATFPDAASNHTTITGFQVFYHAATSQRMRGGMTVQNGVIQSLDAPPATTQ